MMGDAFWNSQSAIHSLLLIPTRVENCNSQKTPRKKNEGGWVDEGHQWWQSEPQEVQFPKGAPGEDKDERTIGLMAYQGLGIPQMAKNPPANAGDVGLIPGSGRFPEKEMVTHSSILAWRIPWTEKSGGIQSTGSHKVGHDLVTQQQWHTGNWCTHIIWAACQQPRNGLRWWIYVSPAEPNYEKAS